MCLDLDSYYNNQNLLVNQNISENIVEMNSQEITTEHKLNIKTLCGGSLIEHKPIFDPKGQ